MMIDRKKIIGFFNTYYPSLTVRSIRDNGDTYFVVASEKEDDINDPYYLVPKDGSAPGAYPFTDIDEFFKILEKPEI